MGMNKYNQSKEIIEHIKDKGFKDVGMQKLRGRIIQKIGGDERTIQSTIKLMMETNLIKDIGMFRFEIC